MTSKHNLTGMTGVYLVAAELSKLGFIVSPTSRSAYGADLLVTDYSCERTYVVQVKTNARVFGFWLLGKRAQAHKSRHLIYALVNLRREGPEYYLVPSKVIASNIKVSQPGKTRRSFWYAIYRNKVTKFKDKWRVFKNSERPTKHSSGRAKQPTRRLR